MSISTWCQRCKAKLTVGDEARGKTLRCPKCQGTFIVPTPNGTQPAQSVQNNPQAQMPPAASRSGHIQPAGSMPPQRRGPQVSGGNRGSRPARRKRPPVEKEKAKGAPILLIAGISGGALALIVAVIVILVVTMGSSGSSDTQTASNDDQAVQKNDPPNQQGDPNPNNNPGPANPVPQQNNPPGNSNSGALDVNILKKVKDATVYLRVQLPGGRTAEGSGFFGHSRGLIITNAHVLGIVAAWDTKPLSIQAVYRSGEPGETTYQAQIVSVDRQADLAVLRILGDNYPPPLSIKTAANIHETQRVYVVGFPFGEELGKNITVSQSSVSSLRKDSAGMLSQIQVNGGMHPGNSGGPVINANGDVIGVAVSGIKGTQINFAIPGHVVDSVVNGRVGNVQLLGQQVGTQVQLDVQVELIDPLSKIQSLAIEFWQGNPGTPRPPSDHPPQQMPGDTARQTLTLNPKQETITGRITLPPLSPGQVYWYQPVFVNGLGQKMWGKAQQQSAQTIAVLPEVNIPNLQEIPAELVLKYNNQVSFLNLSSNATIDVRSSTGENLNYPLNMLTVIVERPLSYNAAQGLSQVQLEYKRYEVGVPTKYLTPSKKAQMKNIVQNIGRLNARLVIDKQGKLIENVVDSSKAPFSVRQDLEDLHSQVQESLESLVVPIPNRNVQPGETWSAVRKVMFAPTGEEVLAALRLTYRYLGIRNQNGVQEAVIQIHGDVISRPGLKLEIGGKATGLAFFDLQKGQLSEAKVDVDTKYGLTAGGIRDQISLTLASSLKRTNKDISPSVPKLPAGGGTLLLNNNGFLPRGKTNVHVVNLIAGVTYIIDAKSAAFDTYLGLQNAAGQILRQDDDSGQGLNSQIVFTVSQSGQYRILVRSYSPTGTGPYQLTVRR